MLSGKPIYDTLTISQNHQNDALSDPQHFFEWTLGFKHGNEWAWLSVLPDSTGSTAGCYPNPQEDVVLFRTQTVLQTGKCKVVRGPKAS